MRAVSEQFGNKVLALVGGEPKNGSIAYFPVGEDVLNGCLYYLKNCSASPVVASSSIVRGTISTYVNRNPGHALIYAGSLCRYYAVCSMDIPAKTLGTVYTDKTGSDAFGQGKSGTSLAYIGLQ